MRPVLLLALLLAPALSGCAVPSGVNEDQYAPRQFTDTNPGVAYSDDEQAFIDAMREHHRARPPLPREAAYDRYLENATAWAFEGIDDADKARPLNASHPTVKAGRGILAALANASIQTEKEANASGTVLAVIATRYGLDRVDTADEEETVKDLVARAEAAVAAMNASLHEARLVLPVEARHELMRAQAVYGVALTQIAGAQASGPSAHLAAAYNALEARVSVASAGFWLAEAEAVAAAHPGAEPGTWPDDLDADTSRRLQKAVTWLERGPTLKTNLQGVLSEVRFAVGLVSVLQKAELPEGAWAAAQGAEETFRVLELLEAGTWPTAEDVAARWDEAEDNVRSYRDAQRFDRAFAAARAEPQRFGRQQALADNARGYVALELMATISDERAATLGPKPS